MRVEGGGTYLGLFPLSREVRLRNCRIDATAAEAYGIARVITGVLDMDGVSVTVSGNGGALGKSAVRATLRLAHCRLAAGKHKGCILREAEESIAPVVVDTEYEECEEDEFDFLASCHLSEEEEEFMTRLMLAARACDLRCVRALAYS